MALALDGSANVNATANSLGVSLTTSNADCVIVVSITTNGGPVTGVTASGLTFSKHAEKPGGSAATIELWIAVAASPLSSVTITVTTTWSQFLTVTAFGVSGADTSTIFDGNASVPDERATAPCTISTDEDDTFIIGAFRMSASASPSEGAGFTKIFGANFQLTQYLIASSPQSNLSVPTGGGAASNGALATAIIQAAAVGGINSFGYRPLLSMGVGA